MVSRAEKIKKLIEEGNRVLETKKIGTGWGSNVEYVDNNSFLKWETNTLAELKENYGDSQYYDSFQSEMKQCYAGDTNTRMTEAGISILEGLLEKVSENILPGDANSLKNKLIKKVFIVHGHDEEMKQAVARYFEKVGFDAIILHEKPNLGRTIIEKINDYSDVSFAAVILSPDDIAYSEKEKSKDERYRARQNVIFEFGFFIGKLGRKNVFAIYKKDSNIELPSDYDGVIYIPYDKSDDWKIKLCKELKACDCDVDMNTIF